MTQFNYSIEDDYREMDREWYALTTPTEEELASGNLRDTANMWDLRQHELWPRVQAEGWVILFPGVDPATIGKRINDVKVFIGVKTNHSMRYGEFKWSIVTTGEGEDSLAMGIYANRIGRTGSSTIDPYEIRNRDANRALRPSSGSAHQGQYYVKQADSLGQALDIVKYRQLEGFAPITPGRLDLETGPNQHAEVFMDMIP